MEADQFRTETARARQSRDDVGALSPVEVRLEPFQERLLELITLSGESGHHRNLLASATGTGKTVMAAVDYARLRTVLPRARCYSSRTVRRASTRAARRSGRP